MTSKTIGTGDRIYDEIVAALKSKDLKELDSIIGHYRKQLLNWRETTGSAKPLVEFTIKYEPGYYERPEDRDETFDPRRMTLPRGHL